MILEGAFMFCVYMEICGCCAYDGLEVDCLNCVYLVDSDDCAVNDID